MDKWALYNDKEVNFNFSLMCIPNKSVSKKKKKKKERKMRQKLIRWKGKIDKFITVAEDFNTVLSATDWPSGRKSEYLLPEKHYQLMWTNWHLWMTSAYTSFTSSHRTFIMTDHTLGGHKICLNKFKRIEKHRVCFQTQRDYSTNQTERYMSSPQIFEV